MDAALLVYLRPADIGAVMATDPQRDWRETLARICAAVRPCL